MYKYRRQVTYFAARYALVSLSRIRERPDVPSFTAQSQQRAFGMGARPATGLDLRGWPGDQGRFRCHSGNWASSVKDGSRAP